MQDTTQHLDGEGRRRKEHLNWLSQWDWVLKLRLACEIASRTFTGKKEFDYVYLAFTKSHKYTFYKITLNKNKNPNKNQNQSTFYEPENK